MKGSGFISFLAGLLIAGGAQAADCPDDQTAKDGFTLERPGIRSEFRPSDEMIVYVSNTYQSSLSQTQFFFGGLIELFHDSEKGQLMVVPLSDLRSIFPLKSGASHEVSFLRLTPKKSAAVQQTMKLQVTGKEKYRLGDCEYDVLAVRQTVKNAQGKELDAWTSLYAPSLQAVLAKRYDEGSAKEAIVGYESIKPLAE